MKYTEYTVFARNKHLNPTTVDIYNRMDILYEHFKPNLLFDLYCDLIIQCKVNMKIAIFVTLISIILLYCVNEERSYCFKYCIEDHLSVNQLVYVDKNSEL